MRRVATFIGGGVLILFGLVLLALRYWNVDADVTSLLGIAGLLLMGIALLAYYADSRAVVALIPGCVLTSLGISVLLTDIWPQPAALFILGGLGLSFFAIQISDRAFAGRNQAWAAIPGAILLGLGIFVFASEAAPRHYESLIIVGGLGLALIAGGLAARIPALFIPGGLLIGIGAGVFAEENLPLQDLSAAGVIIGGIGLGFLLVYLLNLLFVRGSRAWPMAPAVFLIIFGAVLYFAGRAGAGALAQDALGIVWGALLVVLGIWLAARQALTRKKL